MIWNLDPAWLLVAIATVAVCSYVVGFYVDALRPSDTFGALGNMFILASGFFGAIYLANYNYIRLADLQMAIMYGTGGAIGLFIVLVILHALIRRLF